MKKENSSIQAKEAYKKHMEGSVASFAPGRIEFLGNHLDYNGGTVLGAAIDAGIYGLAQPMKNRSFRLFSENFEKAVISGSIDKLEKQSGDRSWGNYCLGVLNVLQQMNLAPNDGFSLILTSDLPVAAGLSSSAAVELATAICLLQLANKKVSQNDLVTICRRAENEWVGLPCGILDQGTSAFGEDDQVVRIDCANESYSTLPLPKKTAFWIFDTGIKHDLIDSHYGTRNQECMDALYALQKIDPDLKFLAHGSVDIIKQASMPENLTKRAMHVVNEQKRVEGFSQGLSISENPSKIGSLLSESHQSSSEYFENSLPEIDFLAELLNKEEDVLGARLTGGGFGGAVLAWTNENFSNERAQFIAEQYYLKWQVHPNFHTFAASKGAHLRDPLGRV